MRALVYNELLKLTGKWRSSLGFILIGVLMPLILWGFVSGEESFRQNYFNGLTDSFIIVGNIVNGFLVTYVVMNFLLVHIPFLLTMVAGDIVAGEGAEGTFRIYLTRSVSRFKILMAKWLALWIYVLALLAFAAIMSLGLGSLWLGTGDLIVLHKGILILPADMALERFALAFLLVVVAMMTISTLCFLFSCLVNNGIGPIIGAMTVVIIGLAIANIPLTFFETIRPYLFTSYLDVWKKAFFEPLPWSEICKDVIILTVHVLVFWGISVRVFIRKDILT